MRKLRLIRGKNLNVLSCPRRRAPDGFAIVMLVLRLCEKRGILRGVDCTAEYVSYLAKHKEQAYAWAVDALNKNLAPAEYKRQLKELK